MVMTTSMILTAVAAAIPDDYDCHQPLPSMTTNSSLLYWLSVQFCVFLGWWLMLGGWGKMGNNQSEMESAERFLLRSWAGAMPVVHIQLAIKSNEFPDFN